jgi:hypothetical protein
VAALQGACDAQPARRRPRPAPHGDLAALIRTIFAQPDRDTAVTQLRQVVDQLEFTAPTVTERLQAMEDDLLAYTGFPPGHWSNACSLPKAVLALRGCRGTGGDSIGDRRDGFSISVSPRCSRAGGCRSIEA